MGFLETLRQALGNANATLTGPASHSHDSPARGHAPAAAGSEAEAEAATATPRLAPAAQGVSAYDLTHWHRKLTRIFEELPGSEPEWKTLMFDARALELDPEWVRRSLLEEFLLLVRRAVADRVVTEAEQHKLDLARRLIGLSEPEAEAALLAIVAEAESFFGAPVREA